MDKSRGKQKKIESEYYDKIVNITLIDQKMSPDFDLKRNKFYRILSPKLKTRLVKELLDNLYRRFKYFFSDINLRSVADDTLVRKILSSLQCEVFMP